MGSIPVKSPRPRYDDIWDTLLTFALEQQAGGLTLSTRVDDQRGRVSSLQLLFGDDLIEYEAPPTCLMEGLVREMWRRSGHSSVRHCVHKIRQICSWIPGPWRENDEPRLFTSRFRLRLANFDGFVQAGVSYNGRNYGVGLVFIENAEAAFEIGPFPFTLT
jgi:hypothetical protein